MAASAPAVQVVKLVILCELTLISAVFEPVNVDKLALVNWDKLIASDANVPFAKPCNLKLDKLIFAVFAWLVNN